MMSQFPQSGPHYTIQVKGWDVIHPGRLQTNKTLVIAGKWNNVPAKYVMWYTLLTFALDCESTRQKTN